jgi:pimeloyl-ACP methyl ester carboxylesterase
MASLTINSASLAFDDAGTGEPAFVFLHDWGAGRFSWAAQAAELSPAHRCLALDFRGHGESDATPPFDLATLADDVAALMAEAGVQRAIVAGHGMGSLVALEFNERHPGRVLGLVMGELPFARAAGLDLEGLAQEIRSASDMRAALEPFERQFGEATTPEQRGRLRQALLATNAEAAAWLLDEVVAARSRLGNLVKAADRKPFMAIWSGRGPDDELVKRLRHETVFLRQEPVMGAAHFFQLEKPAITNALLRAFLDDVLRDPRLAAMGLASTE